MEELVSSEEATSPQLVEEDVSSFLNLPTFIALGLVYLAAVYFKFFPDSFGLFKNRQQDTKASAPIPTLSSEELRRKRIERLNAQSAGSEGKGNVTETKEKQLSNPQSSPSTITVLPNNPAVTQSSPSTIADLTTNSAAKEPGSETGSSALNNKAVVEDKTPISPPPRPPPEVPPSPPVQENSSSPVKPISAPTPLTEEDIEARLLEEVFLISARGLPEKTYFPITLPEDELLSKVNLDICLLERLNAFRNGPEAYAYCLASYHRASDLLHRASLATRPILEHAVTASVTYTGLVILGNLAISQPGIHHVNLLWDSIRDESVDINFLNILGREYEGDGLDGITNALISQAVTQIKFKHPANLQKQDTNPFLALFSSPPFARILINSPQWIPTRETRGGLQFEHMSLLAHLFRPTTLPGFGSSGNQLTNELFPRREMTQSQAAEAVAIIRKGNQRLHDLQATLLQSLLRNKDAKEATIDWIATVLRVNSNRVKMRVDAQTVSSDGFLFNVGTALLKLCEPFLSKPEKFSLINTHYLFSEALAIFNQETRLSATSQQLKEFEGSIGQASYSFVSESFFLTYYALHLGLMKMLEYFFNLLRHLSRIQRRRNELTQSRSSWEGTPAAGQMLQALNQANAEFDQLFKVQMSMDAVLRDEAIIALVFDFYLYAAEWLTVTADPQDLGPTIDTPLVASLAVCPEFFVMDIFEYLLFIARYSPESLALIGPRLSNLVKFLILFLGSNTYITNPYIRSKLVELLLELSQTNASLPEIWKHPSLVQSLSSGLFRLYVDIESTGRHAQFYEKFEVRQHITLLLKHLRTLPAYTQSIRRLADDRTFFTSFMNVLLNDSNFLLDEIFSKMEKIKETEDAMANLESWVALSPEDRQEKEENLHQNQSTVKSFCQLANESLLLLHFLTETMIEPFEASDIMMRLALQLNFFLGKLASSQGRKVNVKSPERFHFDPYFLIKTISEIYTHYPESSEFYQWMAKDERTFQANPDTFDNAVNILKRHQLLPDAKIALLQGLIDRAKGALQETKEAELDLTDAPDEFLDPLTAVLMTDPVVLPSSNQTVDRATIVRHLLNTPHDPFNRVPLKIEDVTPNDELKAQIDEWLAKKRAGSLEQ